MNWQRDIILVLLAMLVCKCAHGESFDTVKPILSSRCSECHRTMGDKNWEILANVLSHRQKMIDLLSAGVMPPGNVTNMTKEERDKLLNWLNAI